MATKNTQAAKPEEVKEVEQNIDSEVLKSILARVEAQDLLIAELKDDNERLKFAADKGRLGVFDDKHRNDELIKIVKIRTWEDKVVMGWKLIKDEVGVINGVLVETQVLKLFLEDNSEVEVNYLDFARNFKYVNTEVVSESKESKTGTEVYEVQFEDGRKLKFDIRFIN